MSAVYSDINVCILKYNTPQDWQSESASTSLWDDYNHTLSKAAWMVREEGLG